MNGLILPCEDCGRYDAEFVLTAETLGDRVVVWSIRLCQHCLADRQSVHDPHER
jgi:hypothetical protein